MWSEYNSQHCTTVSEACSWERSKLDSNLQWISASSGLSRLKEGAISSSSRWGVASCGSHGKRSGSTGGE